MSFAFYDENIYLYYQRADAGLEGSESSSEECSEVANGDIIPPASVLRQLYRAFESGKNYGSIKDLFTSKSSSPVKERARLGLSALKSFMHLDEGDMFITDLHDDQVLVFFQSILNAEGLTPSKKIGCFKENRSSSVMLSRLIHGAPSDCFVAKLAEIMGSFKALRKMALFWCKVVAELRRLWMEEKYIPGIPEDGLPDLDCCLIYQKLQVMNTSLSRKKRNETTIGLLESLEREAGSHLDGTDVARDDSSSNPAHYARLNTGELLVRLGASHPVGKLTLLETGEPMYAPQSQEGPLLTEDFIRENEELVLQTGSVGVGCSRLLSDMQAFKAANPGCILEDFVRWYSPPDWTADKSDEDNPSREGSQRGHLSSRMEKQGNLWQKLWETSKPVPAARQVPLFDEELAVEGILTEFENISPSHLFKQLFPTLLGVGFVLAEVTLSNDANLARLFYECKDYVVATCEGDSWTEKIDDLCQVYESVEAMLTRPDEYMRIRQREESEEPHSPFKRLSLMFRRKNRKPWTLKRKEQRTSAEYWPAFLAF